MKFRLLLSMLVLSLLVLFPAGAVHAEENTVYVSASGSDSGAGTQEAPLATLQAAVAAADSGDTIRILTDLTVGGTVTVNKNLRFTADAEARPVLSQAETAAGQSLFKLTSGVSLTLENLELDGSAASPDTAQSSGIYGGAISADSNNASQFYQNVDVTIQNCHIHDFEAYSGGAVCFRYVENVQMKIMDSTFETNAASLSGGAIGFINCNSAELLVESSHFFGNVASAHGGAIGLSDSYDGVERLILRDSVFSQNKICRANSPKIFGGGAVAISDNTGENKSVQIEGCEFDKNQSDDLGGAVFINTAQEVTIRDSDFTSNEAVQHGGALHLACGSENTVTSLAGNLFTANRSGGQGGAINLGSGGLQTTVEKTLFEGNTTELKIGNALAYFASSSAETTSVIYATDGAAFHQNGADSDGLDRDTIYAQATSGQNDVLYLSGFMPDGTRLRWKYLDQDAQGEDVLIAAAAELYREIDLGAANVELYLDSDTAAPVLDDSEYSNIFRGNHARYGGAICNYGSLTIGTPGTDITVEKRWVDQNGEALGDGDSLPEAVTVNLVRERDGAVLDTGELTQQVDWKLVFDDFPANVVYSVTEHAVDGFTSEISKASLEDGDTVVVTNTKEESARPPIILPDVPEDTAPNWLNMKDHWSYLVGYDDGTVRPQNYITRAEVATIFFRLLTDDARAYFWSVDSGFTDVHGSDWYNNAVSTMVQAGVLEGYDDGSFRPNANITRGEFAAIAARFLSDPYSLDARFYDTEGHWAEAYINRAAAVGWISGYPDGSFKPDQAITRAEAVTLVNAVLGRVPHEEHLLPDMIIWPDNSPGAWYYEAVQEATNSHNYNWSSAKSYEIWTELLENRKWSKLEQVWSDAYAAPGGAVMG